MSNVTSRFENAYTKAVELADYLTVISKKNETILTEDDMKMNTIEGKLKKVVDEVLTFKINETNSAYRLFNEINMKQFVAKIYLTKVVSIINKLYEKIDDLDITNVTEGTDEEMKSIKADLQIVKYLFKRKPADAVNIHFDLLTDVLWNNDDNYTLVDAFDKMCSDLKANESRKILVTDEKARGQICIKKYGIVYNAVQRDVVGDYEEARKSLLNLVNTLQNGEDNVTDVFEFLSSR